MNQTKKRIISLITTVALVYPWLAPLFPARADNLLKAVIRPSRMTANFPASATEPIMVLVQPKTVAVETNVQIVFATGYVVNPTPANITTNTSCLPATFQGATVTAFPAVGNYATGVSSQTVTFATGGDLALGNLYGFCIWGGITNPPGTATQYISTIRTRTAGLTEIDVARVATYNLSGSDQVAINATVPPSFTMALSTNSLTFASDLTTTSQNSPTMTVTLTTNAFNGWATWIRSEYNGLRSTTYPTNVITTDNTSPSTCTAKTASQPFYQFNVSGNSHALGTSAITILPKFAACAAGTGGSFGAAPLTWQEFARGSGTTSGDVLTIHALAGIAGLEAAATDYTDNWTIIGAANF